MGLLQNGIGCHFCSQKVFKTKARFDDDKIKKSAKMC